MNKRIFSYSGAGFQYETESGERVSVNVLTEKQQALLNELFDLHINVSDGSNVHRIYHSLFDEVPEGQGHEYMCNVRKWAEKHPEVRVVSCDDDVHAGSDLVLIPHYTKHERMGLTVMFIPQCTGEKPIRFFCYPEQLDVFISALADSSKLLNNLPEYDRTSPKYKRKQQIFEELLETVE